MNRQELINEVVAITSLKKKDVEAAVLTALGLIANELADGEEVRLANFGTFKVVKVKERTGRNPSSGEAITIPGGKKVRFKPYGELKDRVA